MICMQQGMFQFKNWKVIHFKHNLLFNPNETNAVLNGIGKRHGMKLVRHNLS